MTQDWRLVCSDCDAEPPEAGAEACGACGGALMIRYDAAGPAATGAGHGVWRYADWLPLGGGADPVSLGEGGTPLIKLRRWPELLGLDGVYAKLESCCPTASFKDRGATVLLSVAVAGGVRRIVEDSSGNAGAAIAAYAARAGIGSQIFAPAATPEPKLRQMRAYGAEVTLVAGSRARVEEAAREAGRGSSAAYAGHNSNPFFVEGMKTVAYELAEAFQGQGPDHVVMPVGGGSLFVGAGLGFAGWVTEGRLTRIPKLHLVQATGCMPLVAAHRAGNRSPLPVERRPTVAGGIEIERPARGSWILETLRASGGSAVAVEDREILMAQQQLAELEGVYVEPTSAAAFAGLARLAQTDAIGADESVVVIVTGSGLKSG